MKLLRILSVTWVMLLISQWSLTVHFSGAAENEEDNLQYEQMLEDEAEPLDEILEQDEQLANFEQEDNESIFEEETEPSDNETLELDEQIDESEGDLMLEEGEDEPIDDDLSNDPDLLQEENTNVE